MKLQENKKPTELNLGQQTWNQIQDVATGEKKANGKMLFICRDTFKMHKAGKLNWTTYFDKGTNDVDYKNAFINGDGTKRTLIAKDFHIFATQVLIPAYGQNLTNFQKDNPYEWWVILQVSPVIMLMIANEQYFKADEMLNMETDPVQLELPKKMLTFKDLADKDEQIFRSNLADKFFTKDEKGKDFYCTFRGERGAVEFAKAYFTPKKIAIENVQNAVQSPFMKAVEKLNDVQTGLIGTANTLTNVAKSEQNKGGNMDKRLINEVDQIVNSAEKFIDLLYNNNHPYAQKKLFGLYAYIVDCLEDDNFQQYISGISKAKISFQEIQINKKPFNIIEGDFNKYISNLR